MNENNIKKLVEKYPNDQELGRKVREMYIQEKDNQYRKLLDLPRATVNNSKSTSVTTVELPINSKTRVTNTPDHRGFPF